MLVILSAVVYIIILLWVPGEFIAATLSLLTRYRTCGVVRIALSIVIIPLVWLTLSLMRVQITRDGIVSAFWILTAGVLVLRGIEMTKFQKPNRLWLLLIPKEGANFCLSAVFLAVLAFRFLQIRDLVLPAWVDSPHHTLIVELLRTQGSIPNTWLPYIPAEFYYHFGFHAVVATFAELVELPSEQAILIMGQVINALAVLSIYRLAIRLTGQNHIGIIAALLTGFFSQLPAYYVSWGRYALLCGMLVLPIAVEIVLGFVNSPSWSLGIILSLLVAGLTLTHYRALALYISALLICIVAVLYQRKRFFLMIVSLGVSNSVALALVAPWISRIISRYRNFVISPQVDLGVFEGLNSVAQFHESYPGDFDTYLKNILIRPTFVFLMILAIIALLLHTERNRRAVVFLLSWWAILLLFASPLGLSYQSVINPDLVVVCSYLPLTVLAAIGISGLIRKVVLPLCGVKVTWVLGGILLLVLGFWGITDTMHIINPVFDLTTAADIEALEWVRVNTPPEAKFLINVAHLEGTVYRGTDAGWWIPLISYRETFLPPAITYGFAAEDFVYGVGSVAEQVMGLQGCDQDFWSLVENEHFTHIFIGANGGPLQPRWFDQCPGIRRIYMGYQVHIYEIVSHMR